MARIFISHSSHDNLESLAFRDWLISIGYAPGDIFLDLRSLGAGERWRDALRAANRRCEAVILLASPASLRSEEVRREIILAEEYNKPILVAALDGIDLADRGDPYLTPYRDRQIVDLTAEPRDVTFTPIHEGQQRSVHFSGAGLARIKARLGELGLDASNFAWEPADPDTANPYPGLNGYGPSDAGIFFGRDSDIARGLAKMRELAATGDGTLFVIQAASGAGKSSFLKAGLWPRLSRDGEFEPVAILRPAGSILSGPNSLARALAARLAAEDRGGVNGTARTPAEWAITFKGEPDQSLQALQEALQQILDQARRARRVASDAAASPALVFGIDQAEELFAAADIEESRAFMRLLKRLAEDGPIRPIFVLTLRDDSIAALQSAIADGALPPAEPMLLPPIPREHFIQIIREPARVARKAGLDIDIAPDLVERIIADSTGRDALPLLSVMLEQMVEDHRVGRHVDLTLQDYERQSGVEGALRARLSAVRRDASAVLPAAGEDDALKLLMVPALATWDAEAIPPAAKRLIAREASLVGDDPALRLLADKLVQKHLLTRSADDDGAATLEVAHARLLSRCAAAIVRRLRWRSAQPPRRGHRREGQRGFSRRPGRMSRVDRGSRAAAR